MIDTAITYGTPIKRELQRLGAQGGSLHAMLSSVEGQLPAGLVKNLRFVITIRNRVLHGKQDEVDISEEQFVASCQRALDALSQLTASRAPQRDAHPLSGLLVRVAAMAIASLLSAIVYVLVSSYFPLDTLESWGVPLLALGVLTVQAQASAARHRLQRAAAGQPLSYAATWVAVSIGACFLAAYLIPPPPELFSALVAAVAVSFLVHVVLGVGYQQGGAHGTV